MPAQDPPGVDNFVKIGRFLEICKSYPQKQKAGKISVDNYPVDNSRINDLFVLIYD